MQNMIFFQFPGLERVHCVFQGRGPDKEADPMSGNISYPAGRDRAATDAVRQALREELAEKGMRDWRECRQVHGETILLMADDSAGDAREADGMMSDSKGLGLLIKTADCQAILFASRSGRQIMAIHAGWRGNRINFPGKAVEAFCTQYGLLPEDIFAVRGPSLGPANAEFVNFDSEWGNDFEFWFDRRSHCMNLWQLSRSQLMAAGIPENQIYGIDICTAENNNLFFSYRRDKKCGRQGSLIWIEA